MQVTIIVIEASYLYEHWCIRNKIKALYIHKHWNCSGILKFPGIAESFQENLNWFQGFFQIKKTSRTFPRFPGIPGHVATLNIHIQTNHGRKHLNVRKWYINGLMARTNWKPEINLISQLRWDSKISNISIPLQNHPHLFQNSYLSS